MSFAGDFATKAARLNLADFAQVCEITLNEAQWDPGTGTLTTAMNLSDRACRARSKAYDPRITEWQGGLRQRIELKAAGLQGYTCTVVVADPDNRVRNALINGNQRHSAAAIYRVIHGSATDYDSRFAGILDAWEFATGEVTLHLKTDERPLWSNHPRWPYLRSEWFQMSQKHVGEYAAIIYGKHDGTGLTDAGENPHGMVPSVPVWVSVGWFSWNIGPAAWIKDVYVDGALQAESAYEKVYGSLAGGKIFTIVAFVSPPAEDAVVTGNIYGYSAVNAGGANLGTDVITNPVTQIRHFLINFAVNLTRGYIPGAWDTADPLIDAASWNDAEAWADARGLEGARFMNEQQTAGQRFEEWLRSFVTFRAFWNTEGEIELKTFSTEWPGHWAGSPIITREDTIDGSFKYEIDASEVTRKVSVRYLYDSVDGKFLRSLDVEDLSVEELADSKLDMYWSPARIVA